MSPESGRQCVPFWLRRPLLLVKGFKVDRDDPDLAALSALQPAESFVWGVLPHAARSFAPCILALPSSMALTAALGYLYCRILDTHEDLILDLNERRDAIRHVSYRLKALRDGELSEEPPLVTHQCKDPRDEVHALIAHELPRLDPLFIGLGLDVQELIIDLVDDMAEGMVWGADAFEGQEGGLDGEPQVRRYCEAVLGNPIRFAARLFALTERGLVELPHELESACMDVGEYLQLANVTRDIEKDLNRGVAYDIRLNPFLHGRGEGDQEGLVRVVRLELMMRALKRAPSYLTLIEGLDLRRGWMGVSAIIMARFTERYYLECSNRVGVATPAQDSAAKVIISSWPALVSVKWTRRRLIRLDGQLADLLTKAAEISPQ